jgi:uncharacterized PurR-regulated membrane protein YhhQ (DUF165 family)
MFLSGVYIGLIVLANYFASIFMLRIPLNPQFALLAPAGTFFIAPMFTIRDKIQLVKGTKWAYSLVFIGGGISLLLGLLSGSETLSRVSIASVIAYLVSELLDTFVFSIFKKNFWERVLFSNFISIGFDSFIFISIAFGFNINIILGQWVLKLFLSMMVLPLLRRKEFLCLLGYHKFESRYWRAGIHEDVCVRCGYNKTFDRQFP